VKNVRRITQGLFLLFFIFLFLQTESKGNDELGYPAKIFLDFDPLIFVATAFSAHSVLKQAFYLSILVIVSTILLGRVFCGWVCPLGTLNNMVSALNKRHTAGREWHRFKYYILLFILTSSVFTLQLVGIFDPISLLIRSLSLSIYPLFNYSVRALFDGIYTLNPPVVVDLSESVYSFLKKGILSFEQPFFRQGAFIGLLFLLVLGLNLIERRFWCRYLCPLGAFLGILSRYSLLSRSVSEGCDSCGACETLCQGGSSPSGKEAWRKTECLYCLNCDDICPHNAVSFGFGKKRQTPALNLGRRKIIASVLAGALSVPLLRTVPYKSGSLHERLIRPPGAVEEKEFLRRCVKCGECMKVCITNGLQPTLFEAGLEGIWSPILVPRIGYCEYRCTLCGQVCPTGAIRRLTLEEKMKVKIGLAMIDKGRCLPYAHNTPCIVCEEVCPTPKKAIWLVEAKVKDREGRTILLKQPLVDLELCIGCGICETKCPIEGRPAIYVTNAGESRSKENKLLLT